MKGGESRSATMVEEGTTATFGRPALELQGIRKQFGAVTALRSVDIAFRRGEVHALLGENGAGKSTLMNIAAGYLAPDQGRVVVDGTVLEFGAPRDALAAGIGMIHQHFRLVEQFTVAENLALGATDLAAVTSSRALVQRARELSAEAGMDLDPLRAVWSLSVGEKQRVEILRTLSRGAQILILDEPTAVLTPEESLNLCRHLRSVAANGTTVIFISHKLNEVMMVADRISVMRSGALLETKSREECDIERLSRMMFDELSGRVDAPRSSVDSSATAAGQRDVIRLAGVSAHDDRGVLALKDVDLMVRSREIVGVIGVAGNGQQELEQVVSGLRQPDVGTVEIDGRRVAGVRDALRGGLAYIPEDRLGTGLVPNQAIWRNAILRNYRAAPVRRHGILRSRSARRYAADLAATVNLSTTDTSTLVQHLSGGNAQKLLAGRELAGDRRAVMAVNPTQGLDIKAAMAVRGAIVEACERGLGVLLISADLDEVLSLSDRVLVLYEGRIRGEFSRQHLDRDRIGLLMGGGELVEGQRG